MNASRLPYRDDTFDGDDPAAARSLAVTVAQAKADQADEAFLQAQHWWRTATASNREVRRRHLDRCLKAALEAAADLRRAEASA